MTPYRKTISALVTGLLGWGAVVVTSESSAITASEWLALGVALATAFGVYAVPNGPAQVQVVNPPDEPVPVDDRGAVDVASAAVGFFVALIFVLFFAALRAHS